MWQPSAPVKALKLPLPHLTLAAQCWGAEDKPLLLALHGWLDNSNSFAPLAEKLMNDYRILAIDWPGHGLSEHRPGRYPLHWIDYLYDLEQLLGCWAAWPVMRQSLCWGTRWEGLSPVLMPQRFLSVSISYC